VATTHIDGLVQGLEYESAAQRLWVSIIQDAAVPTVVGTPTVTLYNAAGTVIGAARNLTQDAATKWWYVDIDISDTDDFALGYGYRGKLSFVVGTTTYIDHVFFDVVMWPFNEPLIATTDIDTRNPSWAASRTAGWSDWTEAIKAAHAELMGDIRQLTDSQGHAIYPNRVLDRAQLVLIEFGYTESYISKRIVRTRAEDKAVFSANKREAFRRFTNLINDTNDDLVQDADESVMTGPSFEH